MKNKFIVLILILVFFCTVFCSCANEPTFKITFEPMNGDAQTVITLKSNEPLTPPTPTRKRCVFSGWHLKNGEKWDFASGTIQSSMTLYAKWTLAENFYEINSNCLQRAQDTRLRVTSFNVLASDWGAKIPVSKRDKQAKVMINRYLPDVIGLQEFNNDWYDSFKDFNGFKVVNDNDRLINGDVNYSTIAYNSSTLSLIQYEQFRYVNSDHENCRNVIWALFSFVDNPSQKFIVINTHLGGEEQVHKKQIEELVDLIQSLKKNYSLPLIVTADFNSFETSDGFKLFEKNKMFNSKYSALSRGLVCYTYHMGDGTGTYEDRTSGYWKLGKESFTQNNVDILYSIDHILTSSEITTLYYDTIIDEDVLEISDHTPILCDLKFN